MRHWTISPLFWWFISLPRLFDVAIAQKCWRATPCTGPETASFQGPWDNNNFAPVSRSLKPRCKVENDLSCANFTEPLALSGNSSRIVLDFGIEVGGILSFSYQVIGRGQIGLAFSESRLYVGEWSDSSNGGTTRDGALYFEFAGASSGRYQMPDAKLRGGFRYVTLFLVASQNSSAEISDLTLELGFQPTWSNLRAYNGYFHCSDSVLNKIWYSGAYTLQTNAVPVTFGRHVPFVTNTWQNDGVLGSGDTIIVDGAKRDRAVWPGDMRIAVPSSFVSIQDLESVKNALQVMYDYQVCSIIDDSKLVTAHANYCRITTVHFQRQGLRSFNKAATVCQTLSHSRWHVALTAPAYHMWTMIGTYNYVLYSNDKAFLRLNWAKYLKAMNYIYDKVDTSGLLQVTGLRDWARLQQGFNNTEANIM